MCAESIPGAVLMVNRAYAELSDIAIHGTIKTPAVDRVMGFLLP